jgi:hypothetical protein
MITFEKLWKVHWGWRKGIFFDEILSLKTVDIYKGVSHDYFDYFAVPKVEYPSYLDVKEIEENVPRDLFYAVHLLEEHRDRGFYEFLVKNHSYYYQATGSWLVYDGDFKPYLPLTTSADPITLDNFEDYEYVFEENDNANNALDKKPDPYFSAIKKVMKGKADSDLEIELYGIYDEGKPVSVGGLFYSKKQNFAYINIGSILKPYSEKNSHQYRFPLINYRINRAIELGITNIYTIADFGSFHWNDFIWLGFKQIQEERLFLRFGDK